MYLMGKIIDIDSDALTVEINMDDIVKKYNVKIANVFKYDHSMETIQNIRQFNTTYTWHNIIHYIKRTFMEKKF